MTGRRPNGPPARTGVPVVGVDGCPGGRWVVARGVPSTTDSTTARFGSVAVTIVDDLRGVITDLRAGAIAAMAVDMPIGLLADHPRPADVAVRAQLGPRRSSVFPTPVRAVLGSTSYEEACTRSRACCGKALSRQAFNLLDRIAELDDLVKPADQDRLVEAHPELAFARLAGAPMAANKYDAAGAEQRLALVAGLVGPMELAAILDRRDAPRTDLLDALILLTVAERVAAGTAQRLGTRIDPTGKRAEVAI